MSLTSRSGAPTKDRRATIATNFRAAPPTLDALSNETDAGMSGSRARP